MSLQHSMQLQFHIQWKGMPKSKFHQPHTYTQSQLSQQQFKMFIHKFQLAHTHTHSHNNNLKCSFIKFNTNYIVCILQHIHLFWSDVKPLTLQNKTNNKMDTDVCVNEYSCTTKISSGGSCGWTMTIWWFCSSMSIPIRRKKHDSGKNEHLFVNMEAQRKLWEIKQTYILKEGH